MNDNMQTESTTVVPGANPPLDPLRAQEAINEMKAALFPAKITHIAIDIADLGDYVEEPDSVIQRHVFDVLKRNSSLDGLSLADLAWIYVSIKDEYDFLEPAVMEAMERKQWMRTGFEVVSSAPVITVGQLNLDLHRAMHQLCLPAPRPTLTAVSVPKPKKSTKKVVHISKQGPAFDGTAARKLEPQVDVVALTIVEKEVVIDPAKKIGAIRSAIIAKEAIINEMMSPGKQGGEIVRYNLHLRAMRGVSSILQYNTQDDLEGYLAYLTDTKPVMVKIELLKLIERWRPATKEEKEAKALATKAKKALGDGSDRRLS